LVYKALDNAAHAKQQTERQNTELMLLRETNEAQSPQYTMDYANQCGNNQRGGFS